MNLRDVRLWRCSLFCAVLFAAPAVRAEEKPDRKPVARSASEAGVLLRREAPTKPWLPVAEKELLQTGDLILGSDFGGALVSSDGAVRLSFRSDFNHNSPFPILETAVVLGEAKDVDLNVTLDRGRIDVVNLKDKGSARVRLQIRDIAGEIILTEPGSRLAVEIYGRWPRGVPFTKELKPGAGPALAIVILAIKGEVQLKGKVREFTLKSPPGPALLEADGLNAIDPRPTHLDELPPWAVDGTPDSERAKQIKASLSRFRKALLARGVGPALDEQYQSENEIDRRTAVVLMGAMDDLPRIGQVLLTSKNPDVWDAAVVTMRHWIGRAPGQDQILYRLLIEDYKYKPAQAAALLHFLHSFGDEELGRPELYEMLINYLGNDKLALRGLAHWHLVRLAPAGKKIAFDPRAPKEERDRAIEAWRKLIPSGKLPPEEK